MKLTLTLICLLLLNPLLFADEIPAGPPPQDQGAAGGANGGAKLDAGSKALEDALRGQGIITGGTPAANGNENPNVKSEKMSDGSTRTVTTNPDGSRVVETTDRQISPRNITQTFDKDGNVIVQRGDHSDGTMEGMTYDPLTGVRESMTVEPDGATTYTTTQGDGSSVISQAGYGPDMTLTEEDAEGNVTRTTTRPDGSKSVETFTRIEEAPGTTRGAPVTTTTTEYGPDGKPVKTVVSTTERQGTRFVQIRREETEYDGRGKLVKTTISAPSGEYGNWVTVEEVEYWPNGYRKIIKRRDGRGEITEIYYYDELGNPTRSSISPGHTAGTPPVSGAWHEAKPQQIPRTPRTEPALREDPFGDNVGTPNLSRFGRNVGREMAAAEDNNQAGEHHPQDHYRE